MIAADKPSVSQSPINLDARDIDKSYIDGSRRVEVLKGVNLQLRSGEMVAIVGASGTGKTTLLHILGTLDRPSKGSLFYNQENLFAKDDTELSAFRNRTIGFVFQSFHLVPSLTALENVMFPAELNRDPAAPAKAAELLARVELLDRKNNFPHQLSGGEKQRIAICRALVNSPQIVFADEPTGNLDSVNGDIILQLLLELRKERSTTLVLATHSWEVGSMADRVVRLRDGSIDTTSDS
jgi:putative ABC transport system ATP-binding protein